LFDAANFTDRSGPFAVGACSRRPRSEGLNVSDSMEALGIFTSHAKELQTR